MDERERREPEDTVQRASEGSAEVRVIFPAGGMTRKCGLAEARVGGARAKGRDCSDLDELRIYYREARNMHHVFIFLCIAYSRTVQYSKDSNKDSGRF